VAASSLVAQKRMSLARLAEDPVWSKLRLHSEDSAVPTGANKMSELCSSNPPSIPAAMKTEPCGSHPRPRQPRLPPWKVPQSWCGEWRAPLMGSLRRFPLEWIASVLMGSCGPEHGGTSVFQSAMWRLGPVARRPWWSSRGVYRRSL
jgi:hypothetical protein